MSEPMVATVLLNDRVLERLRAEAFRQLAESIRLAHEINPNSWLVMYWKKQIILLVGAYYSFAPRREMTGDVDLILQEPVPECVDELNHEDKDFKVHRDFLRVRIPVMEMAAWFPILRESHRRAIATAAKSKPNYWREHDEEALREIESYAGETLPRPEYLDDPKFREGVLDEVPWIVASRLASTIALAQRINDRAWSIYRSKRTAVVAIGDVPALRWKQRLGRIELAVWLEDVSEPVARRWEEHRIEETIWDDQIGWYWGKGYEIYDVLEAFADAHERCVEQVAGSLRTRLKSARKFDTELLQALSEHAREPLSLPGYVTVTERASEDRGRKRVDDRGSVGVRSSGDAGAVDGGS